MKLYRKYRCFSHYTYKKLLP